MLHVIRLRAQRVHNAAEFPRPNAPRIASAIAGRFACYGSGTVATRNNPIAVTLREQPPTFAFGVPVRDVVDAVCDELEALCP